MKFLRYKDTTGYFCIGIDMGYDRVQRVLQTQDDGPEADQFSRRALNTLKACEGIGDHTLQKMADGGTAVGDLAERTMIVSLLYAYQPRVYERMRKLALEAIKKDGGVI